MRIFTTRPKNDDNLIYGIIKLSISKYYKKMDEENIKWFYYSSLIQNKYLFPWLSIPRILIFFLFSFIYKYCWIYYQYKGVNVGRYAMSLSFRDVGSNFNRGKFCLSTFFGVLKGVTLIYRIEKVEKDFDAFYIDHGVYLNGIFIEYASKKNKSIFTNGYPYGLIHWNTSKKIGYENLHLLPFARCAKNINFDKSGLLSDIPYLSKIPETSIKKDYKDIDLIVYVHSFTDAQIIFGPNDAYINMYDWFNDVCKILSKSSKKVIIKGHPNFYRSSTAEVVKMDRDIFKFFTKRFKKNLNLHFIDEAVSNEHLLNSIDKNTVLVSHHGNSLIEGAVLGFKCISSNNSVWKEFFHFNEFSTKKEMKRLLLTDYSNLYNKPKKVEIFNYLYILKRTKFSYYSDECWHSIIAKNLGISSYDFITTPGLIESINSKTFDKIVGDISNSIHRIDI